MPSSSSGKLSKLRENRIAIAGARYFVTAVTRDRKFGLTCYPVWAKLLELICRIEADVWAAVLMPDHVHIFFVLPVESKPEMWFESLRDRWFPRCQKLISGGKRTTLNTACASMKTASLICVT